MRFAHTLLVTLLLSGASAARAQQDFLPGAPLSAVDYTKFWQIDLPLRPGQQLSGDAFLVDDQIYLAADDGYCFAVHADTGALRWIREVTRQGYRLRRPCHREQEVIFVTPTTVLALDRLFGEPLAVADLGFPCSTGVVTDGSRLYVGSINHRFYAIDASSLFQVWKATAGAPVESTPALHGPRLYVASSDSTVSAMTARNKKLRWQAVTSGPITADLVTDENGVYAASQDNSLYLFDFTYGEIRWRARLSGSLFEPPVLTKELAYQYCPDDGVVAIEIDMQKEDERIRWRHRSGRAALTADERNAFILTTRNTIDAVNLVDGTITQEIPAGGFNIAIPSPQNRAIIVADRRGRVFCARPRGTPLPTAEQVREAALPGSTPMTQPAATQPAPIPALETPLESDLTGPAVGGRSKVSREFSRQAATRPAREQPRSHRERSRNRNTNRNANANSNGNENGNDNQNDNAGDDGADNDNDNG